MFKQYIEESVYECNKYFFIDNKLYQIILRTMNNNINCIIKIQYIIFLINK